MLKFKDIQSMADCEAYLRTFPCAEGKFVSISAVAKDFFAGHVSSNAGRVARFTELMRPQELVVRRNADNDPLGHRRKMKMLPFRTTLELLARAESSKGQTVRRCLLEADARY